MTPELFANEAPARPPIRYHGSKWRLAPWVISLMPAHRAYVEPFGGGAGVLLRKPRSAIEVYNDIDGQVVNFFRVLRDPSAGPQLIRAVALTPFSRDEFEASYEASGCPVESARRFVFRCYSGHGTCSVDPRDSNGFRACDIRAGKAYAMEWAGIPDQLLATANRLRGVTIENKHFAQVIPKFDASDTLFFCDPPYPMSTRSAGGKGYVHEMSNADHETLSWMLHSLRGKVMVCSYASELYDRLYADWNRVEKQTTAAGQRGAVTRTEVMWVNYPLT